MNTAKKINIISIVTILIALLGNIFLPAYNFWFNILAIAAFATTVFYQCYLLYKTGNEWKKYAAIYLVLCIVLGFVLFL